MNFAKAEAGEPSLIGNVCKSLFSIWKVFLEEDYVRDIPIMKMAVSDIS